MNTKYKVGDKVRVRSDLKEWETYRNKNNAMTDIVTESMLNFAGKVVTIDEINNDKYIIREDHEHWCWTDEMFEEEYTITQADIIRNMSDEELASFLKGYCKACLYNGESCEDKKCIRGITDWLKARVEI